MTIQSDMPWAPFFTQFKHEKKRIGMSRNEMLDILSVLYGGIEAERLLVGDVSTGASGMGQPGSDLSRASELAEMLVEVCGMSNLAAPLRSFRDHEGKRGGAVRVDGRGDRPAGEHDHRGGPGAGRRDPRQAQGRPRRRSATN